MKSDRNSDTDIYTTPQRKRERRVCSRTEPPGACRPKEKKKFVFLKNGRIEEEEEPPLVLLGDPFVRRRRRGGSGIPFRHT